MALRGNERAISRLIWEAEIAVLMPYIEKLRQRLLETFGKLLKGPFTTKSGEVLTDIYDLEIGLLVGLMGKRLRISPWKTCFSVLRSYFSFFYFASFHVVRYYMVLFLFLGVFFHPFWCLGLSMLLLSSSVDYHVKRPQLSFPVSLFFYAVDHISYQLGVFAGCLRHNKFGSYTPRFVRKMMAQRG